MNSVHPPCVRFGFRLIYGSRTVICLPQTGIGLSVFIRTTGLIPLPLPIIHAAGQSVALGRIDSTVRSAGDVAYNEKSEPSFVLFLHTFKET